MKKICLLILIFVVGIITSCKEKNVNDSVIPEDKMVSIISDLNIIDAYQRTNPPENALDSARIKENYENVFKKHKISKKQFEHSINFYSKRPEEFEDIYERVIDQLSKMQSEEISGKK